VNTYALSLFPSTARPRKAQKIRLRGGFTILELLVAITVLVILCGMVMQLMGSATRLTGNARQAADCDVQARFALSQISHDLAHRVRRPDVDAFAEKTRGNDSLFLFSETPGYAPGLENPRDKSPFSLVGYRIKQRTSQIYGNTFLLERCAAGLPWVDGTAGLRALPFVALDKMRQPLPTTTLAGSGGQGGSGTFSKILAGNDTAQVYFQELASNVIRFEVAFLLKPGMPDLAVPGARIQPQDEVAQRPARLLADGEINSEFARFGFTRISAVIVSLAIVDSRSALQSQLTDLKQASAALVDAEPTVYPRLPLDYWNEAFQVQSAAWPKAVRTSIRFYQKTIQLN
jgi:type II secretory pathway pseudopilin PulG